ncbi:MAG: hypothetical protein IK028_04905 [Bacilli bacterium]|nr:hypothetical protein [Bacilli bacterium]
MKLTKVLMLVSAAFLMACNSTASTSTSTESTPSSNSESTSSVESTSSTETASESTSSTSSESSTSSSATSSATSTSSSVSSSSEAPVVGNTLTFNFLNPSCGSQGTDSLNTKLKDEMNTMAGFEFVTAVNNTSCQFMADAPVAGSQMLTVGSAKKAGSLEITFAETIKSLTLTLETYSKTYTQGATTNTNVDANSVLYFNTDENVIDLKPVDGQPVAKEYNEAINAKSFRVYNKGANARVFVKELKVVY